MIGVCAVLASGGEAKISQESLTGAGAFGRVTPRAIHLWNRAVPRSFARGNVPALRTPKILTAEVRSPPRKKWESKEGKQARSVVLDLMPFGALRLSRREGPRPPEVPILCYARGRRRSCCRLGYFTPSGAYPPPHMQLPTPVSSLSFSGSVILLKAASDSWSAC